MKLIEMICPRCGAHLQVRENTKRFRCEHCGTVLLVDDEVQHVQYDNAEDAGYQFEKGRQRAKRETDYQSGQRSSSVTNRKKKKKRRTWLWGLGWLFIFPLPLTILLLRKKKMRPVLKYSILAVSWLFYLLFAAAVNSAETMPEQEAQQTPSETAVSVIAVAPESTPTPATDELIPLESPVVEATEDHSSASIERGLDQTPAPTSAPSITVTTEAKALVIGQGTSVRADIPTDYGDITWQSDNTAILTVDKSGIVKAVGGGKATITATAANGAQGSVELTVDGKKRLMTLTTKHVQENPDVNIGDEWSYEFKIDGKEAKREQYVITVGETMKFYAKCTESDDHPDVGKAEGSRKISQQDFDNGFTAQLHVKVKEDRGKNANKEAKFTMQFIFTPVQ